MSFLSEEEYRLLGEHLYVIDSLLAEFAVAHGYVLYPPLSGGRYPNRRLSQLGDVHRSIHIAMADQPNGQRFEHFFPEIPYTIFGGACIDDHKQHLRWHAPFLNTRAIPFSLLVTKLPIYLSHFHDYLSRITAEQIRAYAYTSSLGDLPSRLHP